MEELDEIEFDTSIENLFNLEKNLIKSVDKIKNKKIIMKKYLIELDAAVKEYNKNKLYFIKIKNVIKDEIFAQQEFIKEIKSKNIFFENNNDLLI